MNNLFTLNLCGESSKEMSMFHMLQIQELARGFLTVCANRSLFVGLCSVCALKQISVHEGLVVYTVTSKIDSDPSARLCLFFIGSLLIALSKRDR